MLMQIKHLVQEQLQSIIGFVFLILECNICALISVGAWTENTLVVEKDAVSIT